VVAAGERPTVGRHRKPKERACKESLMTQERARKYLTRSMGAIILAGGAWFAPMINDALIHDETAQEQTIHQGLAYAGLGSVGVRCLNDQAFESRLDKVRISIKPEYKHRSNGMAVPFLPQIWLRTRVCNEISDFIDSDPKPGTVKQGTAILTAIHESQHTNGVLSEPEAECKAAQEFIYASLAFRQSDDVVGMERLLRELYTHRAEHRADLWPGYDLRGCYKGGPYDLGLYRFDQPTVFPPDALSRP